MNGKYVQIYTTSRNECELFCNNVKLLFDPKFVKLVEEYENEYENEEGKYSECKEYCKSFAPNSYGFGVEQFDASCEMFRFDVYEFADSYYNVIQYISPNEWHYNEWRDGSKSANFLA